MSALVGLIFYNSTNTCSPKKTRLCRLLHWSCACICVLSHHSCVMEKYFPALLYSFHHFSHFTQLLPSLNQHPSSFFWSCFPFSDDATTSFLPLVFLFGFSFASSSLEMSQNILPVMDVLRFTSEAFLSVLFCPEKNTSLSCFQLSSVHNTSCNLEESSDYWPLTVWWCATYGFTFLLELEKLVAEWVMKPSVAKFSCKWKRNISIFLIWLNSCA